MFTMVRDKWKTSFLCRLLKAVLFVGIETSILLLLVTAVNHYCAIGRALKRQTMSQRANLILISALFLSVISLSVLVGIYQSANSEFICIPFGRDLVDLSVFATSGFINVLVLVVVISLYSLTIAVVKESAERVGKADNKTSIKLIRKISLILLVNMATVIMHLVLGLMAAFSVGREIYTWIVVLGITSNASLNPILHTFSTPNFIKHFTCKLSQEKQ